MRYGRLCREGAVSIHAPAREATRSAKSRSRRSTRFNPRPRAGSDVVGDPHVTRAVVSIHAPAREATWINVHVPADWNVSIHAPAREATPMVHDAHPHLEPVSIHAPAREATLARWSSSTIVRSFNPRPRAGSDSGSSRPGARSGSCFNPRPRAGSDWCGGRMSAVPSQCFNPRPRAGSDSTKPATTLACGYGFNPRPRAGSDRITKRQDPCQRQFQSTPPRGKRPAVRGAGADVTLVFQSTPARGKRHRRPLPSRPCAVSIHAPAREATSRLPPLAVSGQVSIHAPAREATSMACAAEYRRGKKFQSTPPRGKRRAIERRAQRQRGCFNPRPRAGSDLDPVGGG